MYRCAADYQKKKGMKWSPPGRGKRGRPKAAWAEGIRGLMAEKGLIEEDWKDRDKWKKKIIVKWAREDVETSNNLLNKQINRSAAWSLIL